MSGVHPDLGPELRQLAQTLLDRIDPALRLGLAALAASGEGPGKCEQVWCPVCALAALASGEQHPMLTVIAEHSAALLTVVRSLLDGTAEAGMPEPPTDPSGGQEQEPDSESGAGSGPAEPGRYQSIPIIVEE